MRRMLTLLFVIVAALVALMGSATADTGAVAKPDGTGSAPMPAGDVAPQALTCPTGNLCVWPVADGSSSRCSWLNSDNDWWNQPVVCSWSSSQPVRAIYNHGTSSSFSGVCLYGNANFVGWRYYVPQGQQFVPGPAYIIRSHRWVSSGNVCFST